MYPILRQIHTTFTLISLTNISRNKPHGAILAFVAEIRSEYRKSSEDQMKPNSLRRNPLKVQERRKRESSSKPGTKIHGNVMRCILTCEK